MRHSFATALTTLALVCCYPSLSATAQQSTGSVVLVHAGQLLDRPGHQPRGASTLVIRGGKVAEIHEGHVTEGFASAEVIDLRAQFVLPGLIDTHVHLDSDKAGQEGLLESFTNSQAYFAYQAADNARKTLLAGTSRTCIDSTLKSMRVLVRCLMLSRYDTHFHFRGGIARALYD